MRKYIELTDYDSNGRTVVFVDSIRGLCRVHDCDYNKDFTEVMVSGYTFMVNEPIDEILEKIMKEDNKSLCEYDQDSIEVGYEKAMQKIDKIRTEILKERRKNLNMEHDKIFELCILIIEKYIDESEDTSYDLSYGIIVEKEKQV